MYATIETDTERAPMTIEEFDAALAELDWKVSDFCRATGLHRNTPRDGIGQRVG